MVNGLDMSTNFETDGPLAILTFNRPEARNAMTWEMYQALVDACDRVDADAGIRVLVLRGAGGKAFVHKSPSNVGRKPAPCSVFWQARA